MKTLVVHPGTQHSFQLVRELERHGCLGRFWTGMAYLPDSIIGRCVDCLPIRLQRKLTNRRLNDVSKEKLCTRPLIEWRARRQLQIEKDHQIVMFERNAAFQHCISQEEIANNDVVIGFDTSSWILAERTNRVGRPFLLDRSSIGHPPSYRSLFPMLCQQFPKWADDFPCRPAKVSRAEQVEHELASRIVVGSSFTKRILTENGLPSEKIVINAYGVDLDLFSPTARPETSRPLRFVFLGSLGARKGVPLLLQTWQSLTPAKAELWLAGPLTQRHAGLIPKLPGLRLIGKTPHRELPNLLRQCDVLVLPSYFEGFGLVLLEALAAGLPIIATDATAAPDLITQGVEGHIIPAGDGEALRDALRRFIVSPDHIEHMSAAARRCAEGYSWEAYGNRWVELLRQVV